MKYTFWNLIKVQGYKIVIPKIQRDYVQGRANITVKRNREEFVKELIDSLADKKPMSLNFVYGTIQNGNEFIPIDGQQRLTTLFLLHLYVFAKNKDMEAIGMLQKQFSYETRYTTYRFMKKLAKELPQMLEMARYDESLAKLIRNSGWYVTPWDNDPNISSCIVMLDLIHEKCKGKTISTEILKDDCPITFMWLQLDKSFGSDNQLYIRMNSRGKQLTDFENFKAELYEKVLAGKDTEEFKKKIDGEWYSMLWDANVAESNVKDNRKEKVNIEKEAQLIDELLKRLIHWTIVSKACEEGGVTLKQPSGKRKGEEQVNDEKVLEQRERQKRLYQFCTPNGTEELDILRCGVEEYQNLIENKIIKECIIGDLNSLLTFLTSIKGEKIFEYIVKDILAVSEEGDKSSYKINSYGPRVLLYAITKFAKIYEKKTETDERVNDFQSWYRIVLNLVSTKEIGRPEDFQKAVRAIEEWDNNTEDWLESENVKGAFRSAQVKEEILKLKLMDKNGWKCAIRNAENTNFDGNYQARDYFRGQIGFLLHMAGVEAHLNDLDQKQLNNFVYYSKAVRSIFNYDNYWNDWKSDEITKKPTTVDEIKSAEECSFDNLFHRAMLIYKNYWVNAPGNNIKTFFVYNESHNNYDWRGAFRQHLADDQKGKPQPDDGWGVAVGCLKNLLDAYSLFDKDDQKYVFDFSGFKNWLEKLLADNQKCNKYSDGTVEGNLRDLLIHKPNCFKYIRNNYYVYWGDKDQPPKYLLMQLKRQRAGSIINITNELTKGQTP